MKQNKLINFRKEILNNFKCQKSGNCCKCPGTVYVNKEDKLNISKDLNISLTEFNQKYIYQDNGWDCISTSRFRPRCFLNESNNCSVYQSRPKSCKTYPNWESIWESEDSLNNEIAQCPGLKLAVKKYQDINQKKSNNKNF